MANSNKNRRNRITPEARKKILRYINLDEAHMFHKDIGYIPESYRHEVENWVKCLNKMFKKGAMDTQALSFIMHEFTITKNRYMRTAYRTHDINELITHGANDLLEALGLFNGHPYNIEEIRIIAKKGDKLRKNDRRKRLPVTEAKSLSHPLKQRFVIRGVQVINELLHGANLNSDAIQELAKSEANGVKVRKNSKIFKKTKREIYLRNKLSKPLFKFLKDHNTSNLSDNELYYQGGYLLNIISLMPEYKNAPLDTSKQTSHYRTFLLSNFKKAFKVKVT